MLRLLICDGPARWVHAYRLQAEDRCDAYLAVLVHMRQGACYLASMMAYLTRDVVHISGAETSNQLLGIKACSTIMPI